MGEGKKIDKKKKMASSLLSSRPLLLLAISLLVILPLALGNNPAPTALKYHGGPLLTGKINLSLLWYGRFGRVQKNVIRSFIKSLNYKDASNLEPQVSTWWKVVGSYNKFARKNSKGKSKIRVRVVKQVTDSSYSVGKIITKDFLKLLVQKATAGNPKTLAVIFTSRQVTAADLCMGKCSEHGVIDNQPYILVGNPETECPGACAWPFHKSDSGPQGVTLQPPSGNIGADAMVVSFAAGLAGAVTNPYNNGFYQTGPKNQLLEAASACPGIFGSRAFPRYTGKVRVNPINGGAFNSRGVKGRMFLLPAVWNPKTSSCWTPI